jgi:hypothetical protein
MLKIGAYKKSETKRQWLTPVIPVTQDAEMKRISVQG